MRVNWELTGGTGMERVRLGREKYMVRKVAGAGHLGKVSMTDIAY